MIGVDCCCGRAMSSKFGQWVEEERVEEKSGAARSAAG